MFVEWGEKVALYWHADDTGLRQAQSPFSNADLHGLLCRPTISPSPKSPFQTPQQSRYRYSWLQL
jgi:hypothetical protein